MTHVPEIAGMRDNRLFPRPAERLRWDNHLTAALAEALLRVRAGPVRPDVDLAALRTELERFDFQTPMELGGLLDWTIARLETGQTHLTHPHYVGLFNPAPTFPSLCADRIAGAFNPQLASATTSPVPVAIEAHVARALARRAGLGDEAVGHFTSGGSEANFTALICALTLADQKFAEIGSRAFAGQPVFYISADSHLAWIKIAHQAGIGRAAARMVPTDGSGRLSEAALETMIQADRAAGCVPVMIAATAGTTNAGIVDPLAPCAEIARRAEKLWFHVDAAWGGALVASDRLRARLAGIEQADSVTVDAHKWFATTMGCGVFLTRHADALSAAFNVAASFMPSHAPNDDPYTNTAQWSRRFAGLRLFLSLAAGGWPAYAAHVERAIELAGLLAAGVESSGWLVVNDPSLAVVCMVPPAGSAPVRDIVQRVVKSGSFWLSAAEFEGQTVIRACVTHAETSAADISQLVNVLDEARRPEAGAL